tara:strand:+ start:4636 stop:5124 length:489 start_codon:yes stop_codon:yes gene_type:complete
MIKQDINIFLIIILVFLLYCRPYFLELMARNPLGKLVMLFGVIYIAHNHGVTPGIISGVIIILLMHNILEGVDDTLEKQAKDEDVEEDIETDNVNSEDEDEDEDGDEDGDEDEKKEHNNKQTDLLDMQDALKSDVSGIEKVDDEPVGASVSKQTKEGFSLLR